MMPATDRRVLEVLTPGAGPECLSTALIAVRTRLSIETVRDILERLRAQGFVQRQRSDPDGWVVVERQP
jgi:DNA-binding IclR family transcriptional regulator